MQTLKQLFQRHRRPGNLVFASAFLLFALALLSQIGVQAKWTSTGRWSSQPALWPGIAIVGMTVFAALHWFGTWSSPRIPGRGAEILAWLRSIEFVLWFMAYVATVPLLGYLPATLVFSAALTWRMGYRSRRMLLCATLVAVAIVVVFKSFLQVRLPGGLVYEYLPTALRSFMLTYL